MEIRFYLLLAFLLICNTIYSQSPKGLRKDAESFHAQALKEHELGRDSTAYYLTEKAISILEKCGDITTPFYAECKHDAGMFALLGFNEISQFSTHMADAIRLKYDLYGISEDYYWSKECFADGLVFEANRDVFPKNIHLWERAIEIYESIPNYKLMEGYIQSLNNLAVNYEYVNVNKSIKYGHKLLNIKRETKDADSLIALSNLSRFYTDIDNEKSLSYAKTVLDARKKSMPIDYDKIRISHLRVASVLGHMKRFDDAISHSLEARNLAKRLFGENSAEYARSNQNMGVYYFMKGDTIRSLEYTKLAYYNPQGDKQGTAANLSGIYSSLNEVDSCYKYSKESWFLFCNSYLFELNNLSGENRFYYACTGINSGQKALPINYFLQHEEHNGFKKLAFDCILFDKNIIPDYKKKDEQLIKMIDINVDSVRSYLGNNDVAIEYWSDKDSKITWDGNIIVAILRNSYEVPLYVKLSKEKIYKTLKNEYKTTEDYLPLYENIWKEIIEKAQIKDGERLFLSLDDVLSQIPIESICNYDGEYMNDKYDIVRVSSTSLIPQIKQKINGYSAALYGGLLYDSDSSLANNHSQFPRIRSLDGNMYNEIGDTIVSDLRLGTKYLPWTKIEIDSIQNILSESLINRVQVFQGGNGTEESFKLLSGKSPSIIHISTHGFFINPDDSIKDWYEYYKYCMEHTGLLMSGVLSSGEINKDSMIVEDGFLRSTEIAALDLTKTKLLVLSACKTGIGGITPFGMVGLQRAFKAAGVETMLLTLSDVDDAATYLMMVSFYKYLIAGYPKRIAFKNAQQALRESELFKSFNYWGNFVLID